MTPGDVHATDQSPVDWERMAGFMRQMLVALDGLWFLNALKDSGPEKALEMDIRVMVAQFKKATRLWREMAQLDGTSASDKASVFQAMAHLYGHRFEILDLTVRDDSELANRRFDDLPQTGSVIGALIRDGRVVFPHGTDQLLPGDRVIIFVESRRAALVEKVL